MCIMARNGKYIWEEINQTEMFPRI